MGARKQGRRRLQVGETMFLWEVSVDPDFELTWYGHVLKVVAEDKSIIVHYHLDQSESIRHVTLVRGKCGRHRTDGPWRRSRSPRWESNDGVMSPGSVRRLLDWCSADELRVEVDYRGIPLRTHNDGELSRT